MKWHRGEGKRDGRRGLLWPGCWLKCCSVGKCLYPNRRLGKRSKGHRSLGVTLGLWSSSVLYGASLMSLNQWGATCPGFPSALCNLICSLFLPHALSCNHTRAYVFPAGWGASLFPEYAARSTFSPCVLPTGRLLGLQYNATTSPLGLTACLSLSPPPSWAGGSSHSISLE